MKVTVLVENTACRPDLIPQHGLSFYIESESTKILFDCGADGAFLSNAARLGVDIAAVDYFVLSHGHYDHGGGLNEFIKTNDKAKIFLSRYAFGDYYFKALFIKKYIGINKALKENSRIVLVGNELRLNDGAVIFSDITGGKFRTKRSKLLKKENGKFAVDDFKHEQCLLINGVLFAGCAHTGIINIYEKAKTIGPVKHIFGGFHLFNPVTKRVEDAGLIEGIGNALDGDVKIYTGHCTGKRAVEILKPVLGERIEEISAGKVYNI